MIDRFIDWLEHVATLVSLPWFVIIGGVVEEVIAPIPSPFVMTLAGFLAASQEKTVMYLVWIAILAALSKTLGSYILYIVADKLEDVLIKRFGKFLGVSHNEVEGIGKHLQRKYSGWILFGLRCAPILPSAPLSVICGFIKFNMRSYLLATFFGNIVRNALFLYFGYTSEGALESLNEGLDNLENIGYVLILIAFGVVFWWIYQQRKTGGEALFATFGEKTVEKNMKKKKSK